MKCPACKTDFVPTKKQLASEMGARKSKRKTEANRKNGKKGGRPRNANNLQ